MLKNKKLVVITAIMLIISLLTGTVTVNASELSKIRKQIKQKQSALKEGKEKEESLSKQVTELESQVQTLKIEIDKGEKRLVVLERELEKAEEKVDTQNENLGDRLRNMYKNGTVGFIDVLFDSNSFSEFLTNLDLVEKIYAGDKKVLNELQDAYDEIDRKKKEVEGLQAELRQSKAVAEQQKTNIAAEKKKIAASNKETEKMIDELNEEAEKIKAEIAAKASKKATYNDKKLSSGGVLSWPCSGVITSEQGWRIHPIFGYRKYHSGMDIGVATGTPIRAAAAGTVIMSQWYGGYGYCVMIDHGNGLVTLYGHNSSLAVSYGQTVSRGQTIAYAGSTGYSTGPHCHFEVRKNGEVQNPRNYL